MEEPKTPTLLGDTYMRNKRRYGIFTCSCGKTFETRVAKEKPMNAKSCGCYKLALAKEKFHPEIKHGLSSHPLFVVWRGMKGRCYSKTHTAYPYYGARGITICDRWLDPANFIADMEPSYSPGLTIDREENDKSYSPDNCKWATRKHQSINQRPKKGSSLYRNVYFVKSRNKWGTRVRVNGKVKHIGYFTEEIEAAKAYNEFITSHELPNLLNII